MLPHRIGKALSQESIDELLLIAEEIDSAPATTLPGYNGGRITERVNVSYRWFPEICEELESWVDDGTKVSQFDLLVYTKGSMFGPHVDGLDRMWSTSTLLYKSEDLLGGDMIFHHNKKDRYKDYEVIDIPLGKTLLFDAQKQSHEVTEVVSGRRVVLVSWLKKL